MVIHHIATNGLNKLRVKPFKNAPISVFTEVTSGDFKFTLDIKVMT